MSELTSHVPDPRLLTTYAEHGDGPLHRVNAWTKILVLGILVVAVTVAEGLATLVGIYGAVLAVYALAGLPVRRLVLWYTLPFIFVTAIAGPLAFGIAGTPIFAIPTPIGALSLTWAGLGTYGTLMGRGLAVVTFSLVLWMTTPYTDVAYVLGRTLPTPIDQVALFAYRFTFVVLEVIEDVLRGMHSRGAYLTEDLRANASLYGKIFGHAFIRAIERSETVVKAMEARGYRGDLSVYSRVERPPARELAVVALLALVTGLYALSTRAGVMG